MVKDSGDPSVRGSRKTEMDRVMRLRVQVQTETRGSIQVERFGSRDQETDW